MLISFKQNDLEFLNSEVAFSDICIQYSVKIFVEGYRAGSGKK